MKKTLVLALIALSLLAPLFANGSKEEAASGDVVYTVAASCDYPPLEYIDDNGNMVGYEIDLLNEIAKVTGVKFEIYNVAFDGIIAGIHLLRNTLFVFRLHSVPIRERPLIRKHRFCVPWKPSMNRPCEF